MRASVLLAVDDDPIQLELIGVAARSLEFPPVEVHSAETVAAARALVESLRPDMVICDLRLPDGTGAEVLAAVREQNPLTPVIIVTAHESVSDAVSLMKGGARDFLTKPLSSTDIQQRIVSTLAFRHEASEESATAVDLDGDSGPLGTSLNNGMRETVSLAVRAAQSGASVLIHGESGTGKELLAQLVHRRSPRADGPFVPVHIASLPETLVESEMFGHVRGAFTGAHQDREGLFERASGGTLFIDEVGEIPLTIQVKLLRVLQFREIQRVGDEGTRPLDVRIVAATNRDLSAMVAAGEFREDLYYRLNVVSVHVPPLRERREDIPRIVEYLVRHLADRHGRSIRTISQRALNRLAGYDFPGNVRELENILERAVVLAATNTLTEADLPTYVLERAPANPRAESLDAQLVQLETRLILEALEQTGGNQSRAASFLEITERRLRSRMERLGIENPFSDR